MRIKLQSPLLPTVMGHPIPTPETQNLVLRQKCRVRGDIGMSHTCLSQENPGS